MNTTTFQKTIYTYYKRHKRELPWRPPALKLLRNGRVVSPYNVLVSEVMLQQTQVERVVPKYLKLLQTLGSIEDLSQASLATVLGLWQGLGYNRRAKYLRDTAEKIVSNYGGEVPSTADDLSLLPGIGSATAAAIVAYGFNKPAVFVETNIRSVYLYFFYQGAEGVSDKEIASRVEQTQDLDNPREWYYALTDYGAMLKATQKFRNTQSRHYAKQSTFEGSMRQLRGIILKHLVQTGPTSTANIVKLSKKDPRAREAVADLVKEKFLTEHDGLIALVE